jgi:hypothetical protein
MGVPPLQRERMAQLLMGGNYLRQLLDLFRVRGRGRSRRQGH